MPNLRIEFSQEEMEALKQLAKREKRNPRAQVAWLVVNELRDWGFLKIPPRYLQGVPTTVIPGTFEPYDWEQENSRDMG